MSHSDQTLKQKMYTFLAWIHLHFLLTIGEKRFQEYFRGTLRPLTLTRPSLFWVASKINRVKAGARSCLQFLLNMRFNICEEHSCPQGKNSIEDTEGIVGFPLNFNGVSHGQTQNSCAYPWWNNIGSFLLLPWKSSELQISVFLEIWIKYPLHCKQRLLSVHNWDSKYPFHGFL